MTDLSPRQHECLRLVWERQATSKEIAGVLGISKSTVDGYIAEAVEQLGARDRRDAAAIVFGGTPRAVSGGDAARVVAPAEIAASPEPLMQRSTFGRPWRTAEQPRNTLTLAQTVGWIAVIAIGSLVALSLASSLGEGLPRVVLPVVHAVHRLTH